MLMFSGERMVSRAKTRAWRAGADAASRTISSA
jgi:hypothetical protein